MIQTVERSAAISNRWVFLAASLTATFIVAEAFSVLPLFFFELARSAIFIAIGVLVFCGEARYSYILGSVYPPLWFLGDLAGGGLIGDFQALFHYLAGGENIVQGSTPLGGFARAGAIFLCLASWQAWRKQRAGPIWGPAFWRCVLISAGYVIALVDWYSRIFPAAY